jgi:hypothetical protein
MPFIENQETDLVKTLAAQSSLSDGLDFFKVHLIEPKTPYYIMLQTYPSKSIWVHHCTSITCTFMVFFCSYIFLSLSHNLCVFLPFLLIFPIGIPLTSLTAKNCLPYKPQIPKSCYCEGASYSTAPMLPKLYKQEILQSSFKSKEKLVLFGSI